jgi:hypothetical protein
MRMLDPTVASAVPGGVATAHVCDPTLCHNRALQTLTVYYLLYHRCITPRYTGGDDEGEAEAAEAVVKFRQIAAHQLPARVLERCRDIAGAVRQMCAGHGEIGVTLLNTYSAMQTRAISCTVLVHVCVWYQPVPSLVQGSFMFVCGISGVVSTHRRVVADVRPLFHS